jgi:protein-L-isoaspartate(D-aspartate) O-methyltransferase
VAYLDFIQSVHQSTRRDYLSRVLAGDKAKFAAQAKLFDVDYWDGSRNTGYGGYHYDGRWRDMAQRIASHYQLEPGDRILDIGCGKGFLLYELTQVLPGVSVTGLDVSQYAIAHAKEEIRDRLQIGTAVHLPYRDRSFDLVLSINALHNLYLYDLHEALKEMQRVGRAHRYVVVDGYRTEREKVNLLYWQLTCECFFTPQEWEWIFRQAGYDGDYACIYYE